MATLDNNEINRLFPVINPNEETSVTREDFKNNNFIALIIFEKMRNKFVSKGTCSACN